MKKKRIILIVAVMIFSLMPIVNADILTLRPNGPGYITQLSAHGDSPNWKCIDEEGNHDNFTTYVANDHTGQDRYDYYNFDNTTECGIIHKITTYTYCNHDGGGPGYNWLRHRLFIDGTMYQTEHWAVYPGWSLDYVDWFTNPKTDEPWIWEDINDLQAGPNMGQNAANQAMYMTQMWILVEYTPGPSNDPPNAPEINGPTSGTAGETYSYTFVAMDPDGDDVYYEIDWGDGVVEGWFGSYDSNEIITKDHMWEETGTYLIKARAKDVYDAIGDWGTLEVEMPVNQHSASSRNLFYHSFIQRLMG